MPKFLFHYGASPYGDYIDSNFIFDSDSDGDSAFKKHHLWRPWNEESYGDKDVSHRVFKGTVQPHIVNADLRERYPLTFNNGHVTGSLGWYDSQHHYFAKGYGGVNSFMYAYGCITQSGDMPREEWSYAISGSCQVNIGFKDDEGCITQESYYCSNDIDFSTKEYTDSLIDDLITMVIELDNKDSRQVIGPKGQVWWWWDDGIPVEYELFAPLPYYWIDYMDSIRPYEVSDTEALSECLRNTITKYTTMDTNNIANIASIIDTINDIRNARFMDLIEDAKKYYTIILKECKDLPQKVLKLGDKRIKVPYKLAGRNARTLAKSTSKRAADAWLKYRYAYLTTVSDIEEITDALVKSKLGKVSSEQVLRGSISITNGVMHVKLRMHDNTAPNFMYTLINANQRGLFPGLYNLWDMVPFSFIADWGSHLGDYLEDIDRDWLYSNYYKIDSLIVSEKQVLSRTEPWGPSEYLWYDRYILTEWPQFEIYEEPKKAKKPTIIKRALDSVSLVVGVS